MNDNITPYVRYIGTDDKDLDLFESQYVVPQGISYNSYVITDEKIAVMDTIDQRKTDEWTARLEEALEGRTPDYLIVQHMEPDHAANIGWFAEKYPERVKALLLSKIFLADEISAGWTDDVSGWFYPDVMDKLRRNMPENANLPEYYAEMVNSRNLSDQVKAASLYGNYERVLGQLVPAFEKKEVTQDDVNAARIFINYAAAGFMLKDDQIMSNIERIRELPALIVHNRLDMVCPLIGAWRLHKALPASKLIIVPEKGHVGPLMARTLKKEIRRFLKI